MIKDSEWVRWCEELAWARSEQKRINKLNAPTTAANRVIRAKNRELLAKKRKRGSTPPVLHRLIQLPHRVCRDAARILKREDDAVELLYAKLPEMWRLEIDGLEEPVKSRVACFVWWDYFGDQPYEQRWPHLDDLLQTRYIKVPREQQVCALIKLGYTPYMAIKRTEVEEYIVPERQYNISH